MKGKRKDPTDVEPTDPQEYLPRVECTLEALRHGLTGCQMMIAFLLAEEGLDAPAYGMLDAAVVDYRRALKWMAKARRPNPPRVRRGTTQHRSSCSCC